MSVLSRFPALPRYLNPVLRPLAGYLPPLAVVHHTGRKSGRTYDTPVQAFRTSTDFVIGLAYDDNPDWARNLMAAGGGELSRAGRRYPLTRPRKRGPEASADLPAPVRVMMRSLGIDAFVEVDSPPLR